MLNYCYDGALNWVRESSDRWAQWALDPHSFAEAITGNAFYESEIDHGGLEASTSKDLNDLLSLAQDKTSGSAARQNWILQVLHWLTNQLLVQRKLISRDTLKQHIQASAALDGWTTSMNAQPARFWRCSDWLFGMKGV